MMPVVDRRDRELVQQLEGDRLHPRSHHSRDGVAGSLERREEGQQGGARGRRGAEPDRRLRDDAEGALRADEELRQAVAGHVLDVLAAGPDHDPVGHDDLETQRPVARLAVLHAAETAGVRAEVAADRADLVARRIGAVEQAFRGDRILEVRVDDAGLDDGDEVVVIDLEDLRHPRERDRQRALDPGRAARQARSGAPWHDRHAVVRGQPDEMSDLLGGFGERHGQRQAGVEVGRLVLPVGLAVRLVGEEPQARQLSGNGPQEGSAGLRIDRALGRRGRGGRRGEGGGHGGAAGAD